MKPLLSRSRIEAVGTFVLLTMLVIAARIWLLDLHVFGGARIDIALIALSLTAISRGATFGMLAGFLLGVVVDAMNPAWMGATSVGYTVVGFFSGSFGQTIYVDRTAARAVLVFGSVLLFDTIFGLLSVGIAHPFWRHVAASLASAILTGATAGAITWIRRHLRIRSHRTAEAIADA